MDIYQDMNDWWVGYYRGATHHYVCLLPTIVIRWDRKLVFSGPSGLVRGPYRQGRLPRKTEAPDLRRIVLRPVNKDEPPSRITQALFRQRPTRKLRDEDDQ